VYDECKDASITSRIRSCDATVGSGKTTAIMAHLLRVAKQENLRHIIVVLPYTNIIRQSVEIYRKALVLPGEDPSEIIAEHHHQADFSSRDLRHLATLWQAPIIVTTAVQFFETLASHRPSRLRKFHELAGSAVFIDEMHNAIPTRMWPQTLQWMKEWTDNWGGYAVLASGSLPRLWEIEEMEAAGIEAPDLLSPELRGELNTTEQKRVSYVHLWRTLSKKYKAKRGHVWLFLTRFNRRQSSPMKCDSEVSTRFIYLQHLLLFIVNVSLSEF
jgi:CRISPR-associated endonuclease/helicase Cas3